MKDTPEQGSFFDLFEAHQRRDAGIETVMANEGPAWHAAAMVVIKNLPVGWTGIGEDIRKRVSDAGIADPHHANCWGALIMAAKRAGYIKRTEAWAHMKAAKSHARVSPILERV